ncbi:MAG TPA: hypothetical protein VHQ01_00175 [Pyrinomonadaceae bacterium]|nr:hypothetical protein [Pyrinomonadaceae bacterium]
MISGFNTDVQFENTVYHVQTEDKGLKSRLIVSLVYDRGTILASKRVSYDDLADGKFDEKELNERLNRQHKLICAAVKAGRLGELKEMTGKERSRSTPEPAPVEVAVSETLKNVPQAPVPSRQITIDPIVAAPPQVLETVASIAPAVTPAMPAIEPITRPETDPFADAPLFEIEGVSIIEDEEILPAEAVAVVSELSGIERPSNNKLSLELLGDSKFRGGDRRTVNIMVCRGTERKVVGNAEIMIKVLGSSFRPVIFHARSDANGLAKVHLQLPQFEAGRAALLIRAIADGEEIELRRAVTPG